jgi:hypothetical protein
MTEPQLSGDTIFTDQIKSFANLSETESTKLNTQEIAAVINELVEMEDITILEAICKLAEQLDIPVQEIAKYITGSLKEMLRIEAEEAGLLKRQNENPSFVFE